MTPVYRRFIAAMGVVFAILATVSLMVYFFIPDFWGGALGVVSVFCYILTFGVYFLIKLNDRKENENKTIFNFPDAEANNKKADDGSVELTEDKSEENKEDKDTK